MSFFVQCLFYYINQLLNIALVQGLNISDFTDFQKILIGIFVVVMVCVSLFTVVKIPENRKLYLDIPLVYIATLVIFFVVIFTQDSPIKLAWSTPISLVADVFLAIRFVKWVKDIAQKHRKPKKKNVIIFICYVVLLVLTVAFIGVGSVDSENSEATVQEVDNINQCYYLTQEYLTSLPDTATLQVIDKATQGAVDGDFKKAYSDTKYYDGMIKDTINQLAGLSSSERKRDYCDIVALRLKTLLVLGKTEEYKIFFIENCSYLIFPDWSYYFNLWANEENYHLSDEQLNTIIQAYDDALALCDNDTDRLIIIDAIEDFYSEFAPDDEAVNGYKKLKSDIYDRNDYQVLLDESKYRSEYLSEKLKVAM